MTKEVAYDKMITRITWFFGIMITVQLAFGGGVSGILINHENRISTQEERTIKILDNSDVDVVVRSVSSEKVKEAKQELRTEIDRKLDKTEFNQFVIKMDERNIKLDKIYDYIINQKK